MSKADSKHRPCPAAGREISSAECGENRASKYACPADCPFNPWSAANYERAMEIQDSLDGKLMRQLADEARKDPRLRTEIDNILNASDVAKQRFFVTKFYRERDAAGHTFGARMLLHRARDLKNDERFLLASMAKMRPALIEVHEVIGDEECRAVDLLDPSGASFVIHDRSLASRAVRFSQCVLWIFAMPHYHRVHGAGAEMIEVSGLDAPDVLREVVSHIGGPGEDNEALREWLADHLDRVAKAFEATSAAMNRRMFETLDAKFCRATYRLRGALPSVQRQLRGHPAVDAGQLSEDETAEGFIECCDWFDEPRAMEEGQIGLPLESPAGANIGRPLLGRVLIAHDKLRIEASSAARYQSLRAQFEKRVGSLVEFAAERIEDMAAGPLQGAPAFDASLVSPRLLERAPRIMMTASSLQQEVPVELSKEEAGEMMMRRHHEGWLDNSLPAFNGLTPRQAAADPAHRAGLLTMVKGIVRRHDRNNLGSGRNDDINWLVRALGLSEILFEPPPPRKPPEQEDDGEWDDEPEYAPAPPLPPGPFSEAEIDERMLAVARILPSPEDILYEFESVAPEALDALDTVAEELPEAADFALVSLMATCWFIFFPPGTRPSGFSEENFERHVDLEIDKLKAVTSQGKEAISEYLQSGPQPALTALFSTFVFELSMKGPKKDRLPPELAPFVLAILMAFINELDRIAR